MDKELRQLGFNQHFEQQKDDSAWKELDVARVIVENKERYVVKNHEGEFEAEILGNLRFTASSRLDFPAVGDWVAVMRFDDKMLIQGVLPRQSILKRKAVGKFSDEQIIASNVNFAFIIQSANRDFSLNRYERYVSICRESTIEPILIISKSDLVEESVIQEYKDSINLRLPDLKLIVLSNLNLQGLDKIKHLIEEGKTYCVLGSSGVGKSTLINNLIGEEVLKTGEIGEITNRGKHVTSRRELTVLATGGILIDTPGMRELGMTESAKGIALTFSDIETLANSCRFADCEHTHEDGCAVVEAVDSGDLDCDEYQNYLKLMREQAHYSSTQKEKRQKGKDLAKIIKTVKKNKPRY